MMNEDKSKLIEVFHGSQWEVSMVKSLLADGGIDAVLMGEAAASVMYPLGGGTEINVFVNEGDAETARAIVESYKTKKTDGKE